MIFGNIKIWIFLKNTMLQKITFMCLVDVHGKDLVSEYKEFTFLQSSYDSFRLAFHS